MDLTFLRRGLVAVLLCCVVWQGAGEDLSSQCSSEYRHRKTVRGVVEDLEHKRRVNRAALHEFLRIPSVSGSSEHERDVLNAAAWLKAYLENAGLERVRFLYGSDEPRDEALPPVVYAEWMHAASGCDATDGSDMRPETCPQGDDAPTVLIYGHYDVQPAGDESEWSSPPFEPSERDGRLYARGASDDKGHLLAPVHAASAYLTRAGGLPVNVKFVFEGDEEIGSLSLAAVLERYGALPRGHADHGLLAADYALSADGGQIDATTPGLCVALRGCVDFELDVYGARADAHSGRVGGGIANPLNALATIIASLHEHPSGRIAVHGAYHGVEGVTDEDRADIAAYAAVVPEHVALASLGANLSVGEPGFSLYERVWARPALDVVSVRAGYRGAGLKTVLPSAAHAKLSARIVHAQDPDRFADSVVRHIRNVAASRLSQALRVHVRQLPGASRAFRMKKESIINRAAASALTAVFGKPPIFTRGGASIPATAMLEEALGVQMALFAFGAPDENLHGPDEFTRLESLDRAEVAYALIFAEIAAEHQLDNRT